jgi:hypothetical protein
VSKKTVASEQASLPGTQNALKQCKNVFSSYKNLISLYKKIIYLLGSHWIPPPISRIAVGSERKETEKKEKENK